MKVRDAIRTRAIVAVNEYLPGGELPTGHVNVSFYYHGIYNGTFGRNSHGYDLRRRLHEQGTPNPAKGFAMPGGVFPEGHHGAMTRYVIVNDQDYRSMFGYAKLEAQLTTRGLGTYTFIGGNCADFVRELFQHSTMSAKFRDASTYYVAGWEPVAIYADVVSINTSDPPMVLPLNAEAP